MGHRKRRTYYVKGYIVGNGSEVMLIQSEVATELAGFHRKEREGGGVLGQRRGAKRQEGKERWEQWRTYRPEDVDTLSTVVAIDNSLENSIKPFRLSRPLVEQRKPAFLSHNPFPRMFLITFGTPDTFILSAPNRYQKLLCSGFLGSQSWKYVSSAIGTFVQSGERMYMGGSWFVSLVRVKLRIGDSWEGFFDSVG